MCHAVRAMATTPTTSTTDRGMDRRGPPLTRQSLARIRPLARQQYKPTAGDEPAPVMSPPSVHWQANHSRGGRFLRWQAGVATTSSRQNSAHTRSSGEWVVQTRMRCFPILAPSTRQLGRRIARMGPCSWAVGPVHTAASTASSIRPSMGLDIDALAASAAAVPSWTQAAMVVTLLVAAAL